MNEEKEKMVVVYEETRNGCYNSNPEGLYLMQEDEVDEILDRAQNRGHGQLVKNYHRLKPIVDRYGIENIVFEEEAI